MPQIPANQLDAFQEFLIGHNVKARLLRIPLKKLKPMQSEVNRDKVERMKKNFKDIIDPLIVTDQGWILDGHHRWVALMELDPETKLTCLVCDAPPQDIFSLGHQFDGSFTKSVYEATTYMRNLLNQ